MTHTVLTIAHYLQNPISEFLTRTAKIGYAVNNIVKLLSRKMKESALKRQTINELSSMSDYELADIGISRGDIYSVARGDADMRRSPDVNANLKGFV